MADPHVLTLDIGTSSIRALLFDRHGVQQPEVRASSPQYVWLMSDGGAELDPDDLVERACLCLQEALSQVGDRDIVGVGVSAFWHGLLGIDEAGGPVTPIYTWADTRTVVLKDNTKHDTPASRQIAHSSYWPARLLWLKTSHPEVFHRVAQWMSPGDYLFLRLFGCLRTSLSMASATGLLNRRTGRWDYTNLLRRWVKPQLPEISADPCHGLTPAFADRMPLLARIPWFLPIGDGACSNIGAGAIGPRQAALMIGTSGALRVVRQASVAAPPPGLFRYHVDAELVVVGGALSNGGNLIEWMRKTLRLPEMEQEVIAPDAHGLTMLPFLAGERSPGWRSDARAAIVGLSWDTPPQHILQAGMEAVAYRFALLRDLLLDDDLEIIATGGALLHSPRWIQILADVLEAPLVQSAEPEASSRGAALLALERLGLIESLEEVPASRGKTFEPNPANFEAYRAARKRQDWLYHRLLDAEA